MEDLAFTTANVEDAYTKFGVAKTRAHILIVGEALKTEAEEFAANRTSRVWQEPLQVMSLPKDAFGDCDLWGFSNAVGTVFYKNVEPTEDEVAEEEDKPVVAAVPPDMNTALSPPIKPAGEMETPKENPALSTTDEAQTVNPLSKPPEPVDAETEPK